MNNRLTELFKHKQNNLLSIYFTAGYPELTDTLKIAKALENAGADFLEIGFPYSDPVADGPTIQQSSEVALKNGMSLKVLFEQLKDLRKEINLPIILMGYVNPVLQYGVEKFCTDVAAAGVDGVIVPDLPMYEYEEMYQYYFMRNNLCNIFLITPQSSDERIRKIDALSEGFIYALSSSATTGKNLAVSSDQTNIYFNRLKNLQLKNPLMIGFGISDRESFTKACGTANGAIIGSAFVKSLNEGFDEIRVQEFVKAIL
ncbi:tryptophan synthase subunit alpha [Solitalea koreensis]|uniref:Tryptophan synthase alpha chain n=1 Tax=Solitalea koreensis TaxID=543615 RepID=A0A521BQB5_9SPHI|nr:tryptophan synthase subunit alpha [Solitalea koreensis]SMO49348.1 tryptophan synthase, alpha chain [Solitalea koreensis]